MPMSLEIADEAYVLDDGIVVYSGPAHERRRRSAGSPARRRQRRGMDADVSAWPANIIFSVMNGSRTLAVIAAAFVGLLTFPRNNEFKSQCSVQLC
jgi:hypothetical protein